MVEQVDVKCNRCNECCYGDVINTYGKYYHQYCFSCIVGGCKQDLAQVGYFYIGDELYCRNDYHKLMGTKCAGCEKYVEGEAISALESRFHPTCFGCITCGKVFPVGSEICYDGEDFFCQSCNIPPKTRTEIKDITKHDVDNTRNVNTGNSQNIPAKCAGCENYIKSGQALLALEKQWHLWCFTCYKCGALLTGEYMGRDGIPYCEKDYQAEFGISCAGCGDYITGKVLQAGEKHYHPSCSRCAKCGEMFGEGEDMYLQGSEIWHPECSEELMQSDHEESDASKSEEYECESPSRKALEAEPLSSTAYSNNRAPSSESKPVVETKTNQWKPLQQTLNPIPYGKPPGFRSVKPPGFRSVQPPVPVTSQVSKSSEDEADNAPPIPPPPTRSSSNQWRTKYTTSMYGNTPKPDDLESRPYSYVESTNAANLDDDKGPGNTLSYSTNSLNSNSSGSCLKKGIGYNQLQHRKSLKDVRPIKIPTNIDPDRLRQFLDDPDHNVYLEDHEFHQIFKMTREKFYSLPQSKKQELKDGILFF